MRNLAKLTIIFVGLTALADVPRSLWDVAMAVGQGGDALGTGVMIFGVILAVGFGIALVLAAGPLSSRWFADEPAAIAAEPVDLLRLALLAYGTLTAAYGLMGLAFFGVELIQNAVAPDSALLGVTSGIELATPAMRIIVGFAFLLSARPLSDVLWKLGARKTAPATREPGLQQSGTCEMCGAPYDPDDYRPGAVHKCVSCGATIG